MSQVSVRTLDQGKTSDSSLINSLNSTIQSISDRAFQIAQQGGGTGSGTSGDLENWLQAEKELFTVPQSELSETDREFRIQVSVPGISAGDLEVCSLNGSIIVTSSSSRAQNSSGSIRFSDFGSKPLFRRFDLSSSSGDGGIGQASAKLESGLLTITVSKTGSEGRSSAARA